MSYEEQTDLRIRRTHRLLQEAMIELITEKGFEAITVGDIAERAMINRATFYRHYKINMYAIFHSPTYRERYAEFLKSDFPLTATLITLRRLHYLISVVYFFAVPQNKTK